MMMVTVTPRRATSAVTASIWVLLRQRGGSIPACGSGSRRFASSKAAVMTAQMSLVTQAVSHFPLACGSRRPFPLSVPACFFSRAG